MIQTSWEAFGPHLFCVYRNDLELIAQLDVMMLFDLVDHCDRIITGTRDFKGLDQLVVDVYFELHLVFSSKYKHAQDMVTDSLGWNHIEFPDPT